MTGIITIGLDCATWDLIKPWAKAQKLPYFMRLIEEGTTANLKSTYPPVTPVAWPSIFTGKNPGKHGIFGFTDSDPLSLKMPCISSNYMKCKPIWDILSENGKKVCLVNIPFAFPPSKVNGIMTSGMRTPSINSDFTHPTELKKELLEKFDFMPDYGANVYRDKATFCIAHDKGLEENLKMSLYLLRKDYWNFYMFIPLEIDHAQHFFWDDMDENHPLHNDDTSEKYKDKILEYYKKFDEYLGKILNCMDEDTILIVVSDHGAGPLHKEISLNDWLRREDYLKFKKSEGVNFQRSIKKIFSKIGLDTEKIKSLFHRIGLSRYIKLSPVFLREMIPSKEPKMWDIDWKETKAYAYQSFGQIYINQKVLKSTKEYENLRTDIIKRLYELKDPDTGSNVVKKVYKKEDLYSGPNLSKAPDLYVVPINETYEFVRFSKGGSIFSSPRLPGHHNENGILIFYGKGIKEGKEIRNITMYDVAPTMLHILNLPIPDDMDGRVLKEIFEEKSGLAKRPIRYQKVDEERRISSGISELKKLRKI
jgi:predicted AlkP superfamily phosphohydrolase/phosphomutase